METRGQPRAVLQLLILVTRPARTGTIDVDISEDKELLSVWWHLKIWSESLQ